MDILEVVDAGSRAVALHDGPARLRASAELFLDLYAPYKGSSVIASSPGAERVLGAAMMLDSSIRAGTTANTVILDVNIASGTLMSRALKRVRDAGNSGPIIGIVLNSLVGQLFEWEIPGISHLIVANSSAPDQLIGRETSYSSKDRVMLAG